MSQAGLQDSLLVAPAPASRTITVPGVDRPVARVLLDTSVAHLDRVFDYLVPAEHDRAAAVGTRVIVRFAGQELHGWIWERDTTTTHPGRLASLARVISDLPVLTPECMRLIEAVAERAGGIRSDVVRLALPARHASTERSERERSGPRMVEWTPPPSEALGWRAYEGGADFLHVLAAGGCPRAVATILPGRDGLVADWPRLLADAIRAALASGRGALVVVATTSQADGLAQALESRLEGEPVVVLSAEHGPARRYRAFLRLLLGHARVVVGTRSAAFAPVRDLGLAVIWDDGDNRLDEPRAPYVHARTVLALRSGVEPAGLLIASRTRSVEAQSYVEQGWASAVAAPRRLVRQAVARVQVPGAAELEAEGASGRARIPSLAHRAVRTALADGPVLVQVPRSGYAPLVACDTCRAAARCTACGGPLAMDRHRRSSCRWCARGMGSWSCPHCRGSGLRMISAGSTRTADELGRAFPGVSVIVSGARETHGVIAQVDAAPRLVVATPGAEPVAEGGYLAVLLLDGAVLSSRPDLGASDEALRRWSNAVCLARPDARVILLGGPDEVVAQALVRWDHAGFARRELEERAQLALPPAWRCARIDGSARAVGELVDQARASGWDVLGPALAPPAPGGHDGGDAAVRGGHPRVRALVRGPRARGHELARMLRLLARERSVHRQEPVRVELDPTLLW